MTRLARQFPDPIPAATRSPTSPSSGLSVGLSIGLVVALTAALAIALLAAVDTAVAGPGYAHRDAGRFVVHEWGTFTSLQGSDGVELDGLQHEEEALPPFVHSLTRRLPSPFHRFGDPSANVPVRNTFNKMETPVIYFHTDEPRRVKVRVDFMRGVLSHYYPAPTQMAPTSADLGDTQLDLSRIRSSFLEWDVLVDRADSADSADGVDGADDGIPAVADGALYGWARRVDAARVRVHRPGAAPEFERFLFYRGLGRLNPAVRVVAGEAGAVAIYNGEPAAMPAVFAVEMRGDRGRFVDIGAIAAGQRGQASLAAVAFAPAHQVIDALSRRMHAALVARGLHGDEAGAMVRTWAESWFGESGARVLYIVPEVYATRTLPLSITPAPDELVRVFVGRVEYLTPADERALASLVRDTGSPDAARRLRAMRELAALGRFLEPKLHRLVALAPDADTRARAEALLAAIDHKGDGKGDGQGQDVAERRASRSDVGGPSVGAAAAARP